MATYTENYQLKKPALTDLVDIDDFNSNTEVIDVVLAGVAEKAIATFVGTDEPSNTDGRDNDVYIRKFGTGGTKKISTLNPGDVVKLNENGAPKEFVFLEYNHYGQNEVTLIRKEITSIRAGYNLNSGLDTRYCDGVLDDWCQATYVRKLDEIVQKNLIRVTIPTIRGWMHQTYSSVIDDLERSCFFLSEGEIRNASDGEMFSYFTSSANRIVYREDNGTAEKWWLRSFYDDTQSFTQDARYIDETGAVDNCSAKSEDAGYRPAFTLSPELRVSTAVDDDGCYTVIGVPAVEVYRKVAGAWAREA